MISVLFISQVKLIPAFKDNISTILLRSFICDNFITYYYISSENKKVFTHVDCGQKYIILFDEKHEMVYSIITLSSDMLFFSVINTNIYCFLLYTF